MVHANPNENAVNPIDKSIQLHNDKIDEGTWFIFYFIPSIR
jgi:hypothetical protein